ncbi:MAG TPA: HU family DNA-binding protein [Pyrinomonadaceae bacterium]
MPASFINNPQFTGGKHKHAMATTAAGKKRMTQSEIINHFAEKTGMKRAQVKEFFDELANLASTEVKSNGEFTLPGFGKLVLSERKAREGRNPATGETIQIPAKTTLKFRVGKSMKDTVVPKDGNKKR